MSAQLADLDEARLSLGDGVHVAMAAGVAQSRGGSQRGPAAVATGSATTNKTTAANPGPEGSDAVAAAAAFCKLRFDILSGW